MAGKVDLVVVPTRRTEKAPPHFSAIDPHRERDTVRRRSRAIGDPHRERQLRGLPGETRHPGKHRTSTCGGMGVQGGAYIAHGADVSHATGTVDRSYPRAGRLLDIRGQSRTDKVEWQRTRLGLFVKHDDRPCVRRGYEDATALPNSAERRAGERVRVHP